MDERKADASPLAVILLYFIPIGLWIGYTFYQSPISFSFFVTTIGLAILFFGASFMISLFKSREEIVREVVREVSVPVKEVEVKADPRQLEQIQSLQKQLELKALEMASKETDFRELQEEAARIVEQLKTATDTLNLKEEGRGREIEAMEAQNKQKSQMIAQLENQIKDLRYEIKTLLQLTEVDYSQIELGDISSDEESLDDFPKGPIENEEEARRTLKRCVDVAQKMTAGYRPSHLRSLSSDPYAFDLRRLADSLRLESGALILLYSPKEEKILYASRDAKDLLGYPAEKFSQDFCKVVQEGASLWNSAMTQLLTKPEASLPLSVLLENGDAVSLKGLVRPIQSGLFRTLLVGVFFK